MAGLVLAGTVSSVPGAAPALADWRPSSATSHYLKTVAPPALNRMGCRFGQGVNRGREPKDALVVLAFGRPRRGWGKFGVSLFRDRFAPTSSVQRAGLAFASGFWRCASKRDEPTVRIALGTSNYGGAVSYGHGRAWAQMVNAANEELSVRGWDGRIDVVGASDIELTWNGPGRTRRWVRGYDSANHWPYYNFGDAAGCPPYGHCAGAWTLEDVWYVSWGARPAIPLPQIYTSTGSSARQWYRLTLYSQQKHRSRMGAPG